MNSPEEIKPNHAEHKVSFQDIKNCAFTQKGVQIICNGASEHSPHAFTIPSNFIMRKQDENGLLFEDLNTGEMIRDIPRK